MEKELKDVVIKSDCVPSDGACGFCGIYTKYPPGAGLYVEGSWNPVCYKCALINRADLARLWERNERQQAEADLARLQAEEGVFNY